MMNFGFQLYSLRDVEDPLTTVLDRVGATAFTGVELAGLTETAPSTVAETLAGNNLSAAAAHVGLDAIESDPESVAATAHEVGNDHVVVPWLDPEHFESIAAVEAAADRLSAAADTLADHGLRLHYHNHDHEFVSLDGRPALTHLLEATDGVGLELDVGWAGAAGQDPLAYLATHGDRISLVHLKDYDAAAGETVVVGTGDLDLDRTVEHARENAVEWLVYEAETGADSYDTLDAASDTVAGLK